MPDISGLVGTTVTRVTLDEFQLSLLFDSNVVGASPRVNATLVVEKAFTFETEDEEYEIDPQRCETFGPAWRFLGRVVREAVATDELVVTVRFDDQSHFVLRPGGKYEAFNLSGEGVPGLLAGPS